MDTPKRAVVYIASGSEYLKEARRSSLSLAPYSHYDRVLCIPAGAAPLLETDEGFERICILPDRDSPFWYYDSIGYFINALELPYDELLYLDTDTFCCKPIEPFFEALKKFDIVGTHAIGRETVSNPSIPSSFPELHIGALCYKNNERVMWLFEDWLSFMEDNLELYKKNDQGPLREALWNSEDIKLGILPQEFCFRFRWGGLVRPKEVIILHGKEHSSNFEEIAGELQEMRGIKNYQRREIA